MRVIAGSARGHPLRLPKTGLRPTMDVVKGAIFSSLADVIPGARVLDLFAGTGGLGIEALSRGAASAVFVENDRRALASIQQNLEKTKLSGSIQPMDVFSFLDRFGGMNGYDLILADPPYAKAPGERNFGSELLGSESLCQSLAETGVFVLEHPPGEELSFGKRWQCLRRKRYGATEVLFLHRSV